MALLSFNGKDFEVDHAVKGDDYVHGYDAAGKLLVNIEGVNDFSIIEYGEEYLSPEECLSEECNSVKLVDGKLVRVDGTSITPQNVGAAPAGYGLGEHSAIAQNWNTQFRNGFYKESKNSPDGANLWYGINCVSYYGEAANIAFSPDSTNGFTMALRHQNAGTFEEWEYVNPPYVTNVVYRTTDRLNGKVLYKKVDANGALNYSVDYAKAEDGTETGTWHKYSNMMGSAPSGFGLGDKNVPTTAWKYTKGAGFLRSSNGSPDGEQWWGITCARDSGTGAQVAFKNENSILIEAKRIYKTDSYGNTTGDWEYVDPPMVDGAEYRTTERFNGKAVYKRLNSNGTLEYRLDGESAWHPYTNLISAAPAGYGLGEANGRTCSDCNTALNNGFYNLSGENCQNVPTNAQHHYGTMIVERRGSAIIHQTVNRCNILIRRYSGDNGSTWTEWEWENPPLSVGVEYRTTERAEGKPVYVKRISVTCESDISTVGSGDIIHFPHNISNFGNVVRCQAVMDAAYPLPHISHHQNGKASIISVDYVDSTNIAVAAINISRTKPSFVFDVAYCKA